MGGVDGGDSWDIRNCLYSQVGMWLCQGKKCGFGLATSQEEVS